MMRVSLAQPRAAAPIAGPPARPLLARDGARAILGGHQAADGLADPIQPSASSLFGPRGVSLAGIAGPLFVCDTGHHRLLIWNQLPESDGAPADLVIGQPGFDREGRNAKGSAHAATLNVPVGVAAADGVLAVADAWNHRVLLWHGLPARHNQPADVTLGQATFRGCLANRGSGRADRDTLNWCYGVAIAGGRLIVADTGNRRVLVWNRIPEANGAPADLVLGQRDFNARDENAGAQAGPVGMGWPHGIAVAGGALLVADAGSNRIMVWRAMPESNGTPCDLVLGQPDAAATDINRSAYHPSALAMSMPYGIAAQNGRILVADTANSRLIGFDAASLAMGASADALTGQAGFTDKGDNRWGLPLRDSLCWPYGIAACGRVAIIADSGNNRVLVWEAAS